MSNQAGIFCGDHWYQMHQLCKNSQYQNSNFFINDFFKKTLFRQLFSGGIMVPTIYAEKLVKLNWLRVLHYGMVFWRVFPWIYFDESSLSKAINKITELKKKWDEIKIRSNKNWFSQFTEKPKLFFYDFWLFLWLLGAGA